jgi:hypothetical protein
VLQRREIGKKKKEPRSTYQATKCSTDTERGRRARRTLSERERERARENAKTKNARRYGNGAV